MNKHEYFMQIRILNRKITNGLLEMERLRNLASGVSAIRYDKDRVQVSCAGDVMADTVAKIIDMQNDLNRMVDEYIDKKQEIISVIGSLDDATEYDVIYGYYVLEKSFADIAKELGYSYDTIMRIKKRAFSKVAT